MTWAASWAPSFEHRSEVDLPEGWAYAPLGKLGSWGTGNTPSKANQAFWTGGMVPWVSPKDMKVAYLDDAIDHVTERAVGEGGAAVVPPGTVFFVVRGMILAHTFPVAMVTKRAAFNQDMRSLIPHEGIHGPYLLRVLQREGPAILGVVREATHGTLRLESDVLQSWPIPTPPLAEQRRIVAKVEALLEQVSRAKERLDRLPVILKRFRQAVLAAACSGELTGEWREGHPHVEPAGDLLQSIAARRRALGLHTATKVIDDEGIEMPDTELPGSWAWCRVGQVADVRLGGTPSRKVPNYWNGQVPWVSSGEVANCRIRDTAEKITRNGLENSNAKLYPSGTVLIAMIGEGKTRGQAALLEIEACTNQNAAGLVFDVGMMNPEYVWYWALGEYERNRDSGRGGNQPALNGGKVRALALALPPVEEQAEVVRVVKRMDALVSTIERRALAAAARVNRLPQAILAKAFSGELVPTDAELARAEGRTCESAEALLARMGRENENSAESSGVRQAFRDAERKLASKSSRRAG